MECVAPAREPARGRAPEAEAKVLSIPMGQGNKKLFLLDAIEFIDIEGHAAEFGVYKGGTLDVLARNLEGIVWGFDSFQGLPSAWVKSERSERPKGHFATGKRPEGMPDNVRFAQGMFVHILPEWKQRYEGPFRFMHVDCDIYESALEVLTILDDRIVPGTVIVFDELVDDWAGAYPFWRDGEWRALNEWVESHEREWECLMRGSTGQATILITQ